MIFRAKRDVAKKKDTKKEESKTKTEGTEKNYCVERILDKRVRNGKIEYLLKWYNFSDEHNSWEPEEYINTGHMVEEFDKMLFKNAVVQKNALKKQTKDQEKHESECSPKRAKSKASATSDDDTGPSKNDDPKEVHPKKKRC